MRVVGANVYVFNKDIQGAVRVLDGLVAQASARGDDAAICVSEAHRFGEQLAEVGRVWGRRWDGTRPGRGVAECKVVTSPGVVVAEHGVLKLTDAVDTRVGRKFWPARHAAWVLTDRGHLIVSVHLNAIVQNKLTGRPLDNAGVREYVKGMKVLEAFLTGHVKAGHDVTVAGDGNWRRRPVVWEWEPAEVLRRVGLPEFRAHRVDFVASTLPIRMFHRVQDPPGADHDWPVADLRPREGETVPSITEKFEQALRDEGCLVLNRAQWGTMSEATYQTRRRTKPHRLLPDTPVDTLWQHVTVTRATADAAADMRLLEQIGNDRFGSGVSYNVVVHPTGAVMLGQPLDAKGTHTVNDKGVPGFSFDQNLVALAVAWIGMPGDRLPEKVTEATGRVIRALIKAGALTPGFDYVPHSLVAFKDCPLQVMRDAMTGIRAVGTDKPVKPNKVQRAKVQTEELLGTLRRAEREAASIAALLEEVPDTRKQVAEWAAQLAETVASIKAVRIDVRADTDTAPDK